MNTKIKALSIGVMSLALGACVSTPREHWHNFDHQSVMAQPDKNNAGLVFYRDNNGNGVPAVNIHINGEYQASLQPGGFSQLTACAMPQRIGAYVTGTDKAYAAKAKQGSFVNLQPNQTSYFRISTNAKGQASLTQVSEEIAKREIDSSKHQTNTLPRVDKKNTCIDRTQPRTYTLDASALFKFNQSNMNDMLQGGREEIAAVARDIAEYPVKISLIEVIGHTDPQGSEAYNQRLSEQRAVTVGNLLAQNGVPAALIRAEGRGKKQPVVSGCEDQYKGNAEAVNRCNQPNRRVEVKVHAAK